MIIESAFAILPEFVFGMGFQRIKSEANAVSCFFLSLFNALHAKNILDPIRKIQMEKHYASSVVPLPTGVHDKKCDVFLDYGGSKIGTSTLSNYGWRYRNYVEAKLLVSYKMNGGKDSNSSKVSAELVADIIRLVALVPEPDAYTNKVNSMTSSARYLLCLSDKPPEIFINDYLTDLIGAFKNPPRSLKIDIDLIDLTSKNRKLAQRLGPGFDKFIIRIPHCTCFAHYPISQTTGRPVWMILFRFDVVSIEYRINNTSHSFRVKTQLKS